MSTSDDLPVAVVGSGLGGFARRMLGDIRFQRLLSDESLTYEARVDSRLWDWSAKVAVVKPLFYERLRA